MPKKPRRIYDSPAWRTVRRAVLERDRYVCRIGGPRCTKAATQVDHIVAVSKGGAPFDMGNLRASCQPCNGRLGGQLGHTAMVEALRDRPGSPPPDWWKPTGER